MTNGKEEKKEEKARRDITAGFPFLHSLPVSGTGAFTRVFSDGGIIKWGYQNVISPSYQSIKKGVQLYGGLNLGYSVHPRNKHIFQLLLREAAKKVNVLFLVSRPLRPPTPSSLVARFLGGNFMGIFLELQKSSIFLLPPPLRGQATKKRTFTFFAASLGGKLSGDVIRL